MEVIDALRRPPVPDHARPRARSGSTGRVRRRETSLETIYCAELVAHDLPAHGPAARARGPASWYDPGRFWSGDRIELVPPFALGGEIAVG